MLFRSPFTLLSHQVPITAHTGRQQIQSSLLCYKLGLPDRQFQLAPRVTTSKVHLCSSTATSQPLPKSLLRPGPKLETELQNKILVAPLLEDGCIIPRTFTTDTPLRIKSTVLGGQPCYRNSASGYKSPCDSFS